MNKQFYQSKTRFTGILFTVYLTLISSHLFSQNYEWSKSIGSSIDEEMYSMKVSKSGSSYVTGYFEGTVDFDPGPNVYNLTAVGATDIFIYKLDANGNLVWAKGMGGQDDENGISLALDNSDNIYTTGFFYDSVDFDPGPNNFFLTANGPTNVFVSKLDSNGNFKWAKSFGSNSVDGQLGEGITVDKFGSVYSTGYFSSTVDFDPSPSVNNLSSSGDIDIFVSKLDSNGNFVWARKLGGQGFDEGFGIIADSIGFVYITGWFGDTCDFDPGVGTYNLINSGVQDQFITKLDFNGNFIWAKSVGGITTGQYRILNLSQTLDLFLYAQTLRQRLITSCVKTLFV